MTRWSEKSLFLLSFYLLRRVCSLKRTYPGTCNYLASALLKDPKSGAQFDAWKDSFIFGFYWLLLQNTALCFKFDLLSVKFITRLRNRLLLISINTYWIWLNRVFFVGPRGVMALLFVCLFFSSSFLSFPWDICYKDLPLPIQTLTWTKFSTLTPYIVKR